MPVSLEARAAARLGLLDPWLSGARLFGATLWGPGIGAMVAAAAVRYPNRRAVVDDDGAIDYRELDRRATSLAARFRPLAGTGAVGILARNHRGFVLAHIAAERAGVDVVLMSVALPAPNLAEVIERDGLRVVVADAEFLPLLEEANTGVEVVHAEGDGPESVLALSSARRSCPPPSRRARLVLLTSGTTGPPKGARRTNRAPRLADVGLLARIPYRLGDAYLVAPPLFHAWGLSQATTAFATGSTLTLRRRFDASAVVELMSRERFDVLAVVPLMLRRILRESNDLGGVKRPRIVVSSGNVLSGGLAVSWMDAFGDRLYNLYGSTEAAIGTIATPRDLRESPGTVGRPPRGVTLSILDEQLMPVPVGERGRVHLASSMQFAGYTDGASGDRSGTLLATGDLGYVDPSGRLHVDGRANDMIVTGGENVFPSQVEEVLDHQPGVELSAVVGVDDDEYGQRVVAFVVPRAGATVDTAGLRSAVASALPSFMVPKEIHYVDALPMTTTGKVIRHRLAVLGNAAHV